MTARILYEADGTKELTVEGAAISSQLWGGGRTHIRVFDAHGRQTGWVQTREAHLIVGTIDVTDSHVTDGHVYLSTACLHDQHDYCNSTVGHAGDKVPARCKFCPATCVCDCHTPEGVNAR